MVHSKDQSVDISIIIVNWNTKELLLDCLTSAFQTIKNVTFEVWLVDNASTDGSVETAKDRFPEIRVIENQENLGYAVANNRALKRMRGRYALLLNTDAVLTDGAVEEIYCFMDKNPEIASRFNIMSIPHFIVFKKEHPVERIVGAVGRGPLEDALKKHL